MLERGPISFGLLVLHTCDNTLCVAIEHLYLGTHQQNSRDIFARNRRSGGNNRTGRPNKKHKEHCILGHALAPWVAVRQKRPCLICADLRAMRNRDNNRRIISLAATVASSELDVLLAAIRDHVTWEDGYSPAPEEVQCAFSSYIRAKSEGYGRGVALANKLNVNPVQLSAIRLGKFKSSIYYICRLMKACGDVVED